MARRNQRSVPPPELDSGDIQELDRADIEKILRAADPLAGVGGRTTLVKILRGSKAQKIQPYLDNPAHGALADHSEPAVLQMVHWCIEHGYLQIIRVDGFPLLGFTDRGLAIEVFTLAAEQIGKLDRHELEFFVNSVDLPHPVLFAIFDMVEAAGPERYHKALQVWQAGATKKMNQRIREIFSNWERGVPVRKRVFERALLDENVSKNKAQATLYQCKKSIFVGHVEDLPDQWAGRQDVDLAHYLAKQGRTVFITRDRPFHNALLDNQIPSIYLDSENSTLTLDPLPGIKPRGILAKGKIQESAPVTTDDSEGPPLQLFVPATARGQKKWRIKRRRVRNYFGGVERMKEIRITVSGRRGSREGEYLVGIRLRIESTAGIKALDAVEAYYQIVGSAAIALVAAVIVALRLGISGRPVRLFYDCDAIKDLPEDVLSDQVNEYWDFLKESLGGDVELSKTGGKNPHMAKLNRKLHDLATTKTNEVVPFDVAPLIQRWRDQERVDCG